MINNAVAYNLYEKSELLGSLETLFNEINKRMHKCIMSLDEVFKRLKQCSAINSRQTYLNRISKLQSYKDNCNDINLELSAIIDWVDAEYIRMNKGFVSLWLHDVIQKINKNFPGLMSASSEVLKYINNQACSGYHKDPHKRNDLHIPVDLGQNVGFQQAGAIG
jgi:hypothetical protein